MGALTHQDRQCCSYIHKVIWLCHSLDICGRNWTVVQSHLRYKDQILDITGFLVKCGLIWLNMGINAAWFDWTLAIYTTPLTYRDWKQCHEKYFYFVKRAIPIGNFVGYHPSIILYFWSCGGTYPPGWTVLFIHEVILLCHSMDIWDPNWTVVKSLFWYQDQTLYVYCWVHVLMQLNFIQHGHHCGLIWLNIGNLPNTPHISKLKVVLWKVCLHRPKGDPNWCFVGDELRIICIFEASRGHLPTRIDNVVAIYTKWFGNAIHWTFVAEIGLLYNVISDMRTNFGYNWVLGQMRLNLTEHGHYCGLIWLNIGNLDNTPHISRLKTVPWKVFLFCQKGDPHW